MTRTVQIIRIVFILVSGVYCSLSSRNIETENECLGAKHEQFLHKCDICLAHTQEFCEKCVEKNFDRNYACEWISGLYGKRVVHDGDARVKREAKSYHSAPSRALPRMAFCLFGSVAKWHKSGEAIISGRDKTSSYVNIRAVYAAYDRHLFHPMLTSNLPRTSAIDVFIHSWVPSLAVQEQLLTMYKPVQYSFEDNLAWAKAEVRRNRSRHQLPERSMWTSVSRSLGLAMAHTSGPRNGRVYEWIILSRPDVLHWHDFSLPILTGTSIFTAAPRAKNAEMACHAGRPCDIEFGADVHFTLTHKGAAWLARIPEAFTRIDLTPHSGFLRNLMSRGGFTLKHDDFRLGKNVLTYKHAVDLISTQPACPRLFEELYGIRSEDFDNSKIGPPSRIRQKLENGPDDQACCPIHPLGCTGFT